MSAWWSRTRHKQFSVPSGGHICPPGAGCRSDRGTGVGMPRFRAIGRVLLLCGACIANEALPFYTHSNRTMGNSRCTVRA